MKAGARFLTVVFLTALFPGIAAATPVVTRCGATIHSVTKTEPTSDLGANSATFVALPGASITVKVPNGEERCLRIRLAGVTSCSGDVSNFCRVKVTDNGAAIAPSSIAFDSNNETNKARAFEWITRVGKGEHKISVRIRGDSATTQFLFSGYTMTVEVAE